MSSPMTSLAAQSQTKTRPPSPLETRHGAEAEQKNCHHIIDRISLRTKELQNFPLEVHISTFLLDNHFQVNGRNFTKGIATSSHVDEE